MPRKILLSILACQTGFCLAENISIISQSGAGNSAVVIQQESNSAAENVLELIATHRDAGGAAIVRQKGKSNLSVIRRNGGGVAVKSQAPNGIK